MTEVLERLRKSLQPDQAIAREIGRGGMAIVFLERDVRHGRNVAIKVLRPDLGDALGLVHRDIKPEGIRFQAGHAPLSDFGIARAVRAAGGERLTESGIAVGTVLYMSPSRGWGAARWTRDPMSTSDGANSAGGAAHSAECC